MISFKLSYLIILIVIYTIFLVTINIKERRDLFSNVLSFIFFLYLVSVVFITLLPIPIDSIVKSEGIFPKQENNFIPFYIFWEVFNQNILMTSAIWNIGGNLLLLFPFGFLYPFIKKYKKITMLSVFKLGFLFSISIEIMQVIVSSLINYQYRSFDIDDIILNTVGTIVGFLMFKFVDFVIKPNFQMGNIHNS